MEKIGGGGWNVRGTRVKLFLVCSNFSYFFLGILLLFFGHIACRREKRVYFLVSGKQKHSSAFWFSLSLLMNTSNSLPLSLSLSRTVSHVIISPHATTFCSRNRKREKQIILNKASLYLSLTTSAYKAKNNGKAMAPAKLSNTLNMYSFLLMLFCIVCMLSLKIFYM